VSRTGREEIARQMSRLSPDKRAHMDAVFRAIDAELGPARRPRQIPDFDAAYRTAVVEMHGTGEKLIWANATTRISEARELPDLNPSTVRRWADEDGLPNPAAMARRLGLT
jgi:hypothetical protein